MSAYRLYLRTVMPAVARIANAQDGRAYRYLAETVQAFPQPGTLADELTGLGFSVSVERMTFGIAAIHTATKAA